MKNVYPNPWSEPIVINSFSGALVNKKSQFRIKYTEASLLDNFLISDGDSLVKEDVGYLAQYTGPFTGNKNGATTARWENGTTTKMFAIGTTLCKDAGTTYSSVGTISDAATNFCMYNNKVIVFNQGRPYMYDGTDFRALGIDPPASACTAAAGTSVAATGTITVTGTPAAYKANVNASGKLSVTGTPVTATDAVKASGTITIVGMKGDVIALLNGSTFQVSTQTFTFVTSRAAAGQVTNSTDTVAMAVNIAAAINLDLAATVTAAASGSVVTVTAVTAGTAGNSISFVPGTITYIGTGEFNMVGGADGLHLGGGAAAGSAETFVVGTQTFTFKASRAVTGEVGIFTSPSAQAEEIKRAINLDLDTVSATRAGGEITITSITEGTAGNSIALTESSAAVSVTGSGYLSGGVDAVSGDTITVGTETFTFKTARTGSGEITVSANNTTQAHNIAAAITADIPAVATADHTDGVVTVTSTVMGTDGNDITLAESATGVAVSGTTLTGGIGNILATGVQYKIVFMTDEGHKSNAGSASTAIDCSGSKVNLTDIPVGAANTGVTKREIYRTDSVIDTGLTGLIYRYVGIINDNTTTTYEDDLDPASATVALETDNNIPPNGSFGTVYRGHIFMLTPSSNTLSWCKLANEDAWPSANQQDVSADSPNGGCPTALGVSYDSLIIARTTGVSLIKGTIFEGANVDYIFRTLSFNYGTTSPKTCLVSDDAVMYLSPLGVHRVSGVSGEVVFQFDNITTADVAEPILATIKDINATYFNKACAYDFDKKLLVSVTTGASTTNNIILVYDYRQKTWSILNYGMDCFTEENNILYGASGDNVYKVMSGEAADTADLPALYESGHIEVSKGQLFQFGYAKIYFYASTDTHYFYYYIDGKDKSPLYPLVAEEVGGIYCNDTDGYCNDTDAYCVPPKDFSVNTINFTGKTRGRTIKIGFESRSGDLKIYRVELFVIPLLEGRK